MPLKGTICRVGRLTVAEGAQERAIASMHSQMVLQMPLGDERLMADDTWDRLRCGMQELVRLERERARERLTANLADVIPGRF